MSGEEQSVGDLLAVLRVLADGQMRPLNELSERLECRRIDCALLIDEATRFGAQLDLSDDCTAIVWRDPCVWYDSEDIIALLDPGALNQLGCLKVLDVIDSTNRYVMDLSSERTAHGLCCLTETQYAGRGRRGRSWHSPLGNVYLSVGWETKRAPMALSGLSLAIGVAVAEALEANGAEVTLKWPNDVHHRGKKLAGILIETQKLVSGATLLVVGIGVNVSKTPFDAASGGWTDLSRVLQRPADRTQVVADLISSTLSSLEAFESSGFSVFVDRWNARHAMRGCRVILTDQNTELTGKALEVDDQGAFRLDVGGEVRVINAGPFSLRLVE